MRRNSCRTAPIVVAVLALALGGCESMSDATTGMRDRIAVRQAPHVKTFEAPQRATYEALRAASAKMGYRFVRGGPAQGEFEAVTGIAPGETRSSARQLSMKAKLTTTLDGKGTEVSVRITEIIEADSSNRAGLATETPLRDTPQYEVLFRRVQEELTAKPQ